MLLGKSPPPFVNACSYCDVDVAQQNSALLPRLLRSLCARVCTESSLARSTSSRPRRPVSCVQSTFVTMSDHEEGSDEVPVSAPDNYDHLLLAAVQAGDVDSLTHLLHELHADPSANYNRALRVAAEHGHVPIIELLLADERVMRPTAALSVAAEHGHTEVVKRLLGDRRFKSSAGGIASTALCEAARNGHLDTVEVLLQDSRVDPSARGSRAVRAAAKQGHEVIVRRLLADPRVTPWAADFEALVGAASNGLAAMVQLLLLAVPPALAHVCLAPSIPKALIGAASRGHVEVVDCLLDDPGVEPFLSSSSHILRDALQQAAVNGHVTVVTRLLRRNRQFAPYSETLLGAALHGHAAVVDVLLDDARVRASAASDALGILPPHTALDVLQRLLRHPQVDACDDCWFFALRDVIKHNHRRVIVSKIVKAVMASERRSAVLPRWYHRAVAGYNSSLARCLLLRTDVAWFLHESITLQQARLMCSSAQLTFDDRLVRLVQLALGCFQCVNDPRPLVDLSPASLQRARQRARWQNDIDAAIGYLRTEAAANDPHLTVLLRSSPPPNDSEVIGPLLLGFLQQARSPQNLVDFYHLMVSLDTDAIRARRLRPLFEPVDTSVMGVFLRPALHGAALVRLYDEVLRARLEAHSCVRHCYLPLELWLHVAQFAVAGVDH